MNNKSKGEKIFILGILFAACFAMFCLTGCKVACAGCTVACDNSDIGCTSGLGCLSEGVASEDSCISTNGCVDFEAPYDGESGKVYLTSCEYVEEGCDGTTGCYNGTFCGGCGACGTCGIFWGYIEGYGEDESEIGCIRGCASCDDTDGEWKRLLDRMYRELNID